MSVSMKAARGTKRTCQSSECGVRFYDLARSPIICPVCNTEYKLAVSLPTAAAAGAAAAAADEKARRAAKAPEGEEALADGLEPALVDGDEALAAIEAEDDTVSVGEDETFLEAEEDEGTDVTGIIGGVGPEGEEEV
jgi:uncharacterized protein (TIGR02300 family)